MRHLGARLTGLLEFQNTNKSERKEINASMSGGGTGWSFNASVNSLMKKFDSSKRLKINFEQLGGKKGGTYPLSQKGLLAAVKNLPKEAVNAAKPFRMVVESYETLPDWPSPRIVKELSDQEILAKAYWRLKTLLGYANQVLLNQSNWMLKFDTKIENVRDLFDDIQEEMVELRNLATQCQIKKSCDVDKWRNWNDLKYRARFPLNGSFKNLNYDRQLNKIDTLPSVLANARVKFWIEEPYSWRCKYEEECTKMRDIQVYREQIERDIQKFMGF